MMTAKTLKLNRAESIDMLIKFLRCSESIKFLILKYLISHRQYKHNFLRNSYLNISKFILNIDIRL